MWSFRKRKIAGGPSNPETQGEAINYSDLPLESLQADLANVQERLAAYAAEATNLFQAKMAGNLHDGDYNVKVSAISQDEVRLRKKEQELLSAIGAKTSAMARTALGQADTQAYEQ